MSDWVSEFFGKKCGVMQQFVSKVDLYRELKQAIKTQVRKLVRGGRSSLQTTVATLLLVTSAVILTCVVINYAVVAVQDTLQTSNIPQLDQLKSIQNSVLNQTNYVLNQTITQPQNSPLPSS